MIWIACDLVSVGYIIVAMVRLSRQTAVVYHWLEEVETTNFLSGTVRFADGSVIRVPIRPWRRLCRH